MAVPILKQGPFLIASIQAALTDADLLQLQDDLMDQVGRFRSRGIIVDVTALDVMDSFVSRTLRGIAHMTRLRGAETVIVGIQPEVAFAMVQLGLTLEDVAHGARPRGGARVPPAPARRGERREWWLTCGSRSRTDADVVTARQEARAMGASLGLQHHRPDPAGDGDLRGRAQHHDVRRRGRGRAPRRARTRARGIEVRSHGRTARASRTSSSRCRTATRPATGSGSGLPGARRLVDEFELETATGEGTRIRLVKWARA